MSALLQLTSVSRRFGAVQALHGADFDLQRGEVHALLGENGAGKSTLMRIVNGMIRPDQGRMTINGRPVQPASPQESLALGIGMVHQHFSAVPAFSVGHNIALAAGWSPSPRTLAPRLEALMERVGLSLPGQQLAGELTVAQKQALEILMALAGEARILLLDEPTAVLAAADASRVLSVVRQFAGQGGGAVLITHKLEEALRHADRITVLRRGRVTLTGAARELAAEDLVRAMLGEAVPAGGTPLSGTPGRTIATCRDLSAGADAGGTGLRQVNLELLGGEVVGVASVEGNGERELLRILGGILPPGAGQCRVDGTRCFIPEDRTTEALIPTFTLTENRLLAEHTGPAWIDWNAEREKTRRLIERSGTRASGPDSPAAALSGGNQQRFVIGRELEAEPSLIVAENPERGLDFQATLQVFDRLRTAASNGAAVIFHSIDLDDVVAHADRIVVMHEGHLVEAPAGSDRDSIGRLMLTGVMGVGG